MVEGAGKSREDGGDEEEQPCLTRAMQPLSASDLPCATSLPPTSPPTTPPIPAPTFAQANSTSKRACTCSKNACAITTQMSLKPTPYLSPEPSPRSCAATRRKTSSRPTACRRKSSRSTSLSFPSVTPVSTP